MTSQSKISGLPSNVRRYRRWLLLAPLAGLATALFLLTIIPPTYTASGAVFVEPRTRRTVTAEVHPTPSGPDASLVDTQVSTLASEAVLRRVVASERLTEDPEFYPGPQTGFIAGLNALIRDPQPVADPETHAVAQLARQVRIKRAATSFVIAVNATSPSPAKAARIVNAVMQAYLDNQTAAKAEDARRANARFDARIGELREQVRLGEMRLEEFRKANQSVVSEGGLVPEQQLGKLNLELATARSVAAEAASRLEQARAAANSGRPELLPEAVTSGLVQKLREQYSQIAQREAALAQQLKGRHPVLLDVRSQLSELRSQINDELAHIAASAEGEAEIAQARERDILAATERAKAEVARSHTAQVRMRELEQDLAASRELLGSFIATAAQSLEQAHPTTPEARVIAPAAVPTRQSFPSPLLVLALGAIGGLGIGVGRALLGAAFQSRLRGVESGSSPMASLPLKASLPLLPREKTLLERSGSWLTGSGADPSFNDVLEAVTEPKTETAKRYRQSILRLVNRLSHGAADGSPAIVAMVSPRPGAGTSSTALAIATAAAAGGHRTLLVDASPESADLSDVFAPRFDHGTVVVLDSRDDLAKITSRDLKSGLAVLPIALADLKRLKSTQRRRLADGLSALAKTYDVVVIDAGPVLEEEAALILLPLAGDVLFVAADGTTPLTELEETVEVISAAAKDAERGLILNRTA